MNQAPILPSTTADWRVLRWEPLLGSGERLSIAVIVQAADGLHSHMMLRPGVLQFLYGEQGDAALSLVKSATLNALTLAQRCGLAQADPCMEGFFLDPIRRTRAESGKVAAKQAAALFCSLATSPTPSGEDSDVQSDATYDHATLLHVGKALEHAVSQRHPTLARHFFQSATPMTGGHPIRYAFLSEFAAVQVTAFRKGLISQGSSSARLRMWELMTVMSQSGRRGALIVVEPDAAQLPRGSKTAQNLARRLTQLQAEADLLHIKVFAVTSIEAAATALAAFADPA